MEARKDAIRNCSMVGGCFDILKVDPYDLAKDSAKFFTAFDPGELVDMPDQKWSKPIGLDFLPAYGGSFDKDVAEVSSSYDFQRSITKSGSLTVSDATGQLFSATLSASFQNVQQQTGSRSKVVTYATYSVNQFRLRMSDDSDLSDAMKSRFQQLPDTKSDAYTTFLQQCGTHYIRSALFGGRATQRTWVSTADYLSFVQDNIDLKAEASLSLEVMRSAGNAALAQKHEQKVTHASSFTQEKIGYVGGAYNQQYLDMWAMQVPEAPMPIEAEFAPLYELLTPARLLEPAQLADPAAVALVKAKQALLKEATDAYLTTRGVDLDASLLHYGDTIELALADTGPPRLLSADAANPGAVRTTAGGDLAGNQRLPAQRWMFVSPAKPASRDPVAAAAAGPFVALRNGATGLVLDAQAGSDDDYRPGRGLAGTVDKDPAAASAQWTVEVIGGDARATVLDGDVVRLRSRWQLKNRANPGCLLGEAPDDASQRVFGFGDDRQPGVFWRIRRVAGH